MQAHRGQTKGPELDAEEYRRVRGDHRYWRSHLEAVLARHDLGAPPGEPEAGENPTYPTFLWGELAIKFFGGPLPWREAFRRERSAHQALAADPGIPAPRGLASGELGAGSWPYLVTERVGGTRWRAGAPEEVAWAGELGAMVRRLQGLTGGEPVESGAEVTVLEALEGSAFPELLRSEIGDFLAAWPGAAPVLTHGDLVGMHVFVEGTSVRAVIDWGDAGRADPHYELGKPLLGMLRGEPALREAFLEGAGWERGDDFACRALAQALRRQADGRRQHLGFDVFHRVPEVLGGRRAGGLGELAGWLFGG
jgi:hypothetical protein